jgi:signal transduction histidine kinase
MTPTHTLAALTPTRQWQVLAGILMILGGFIGWSLYAEYAATDVQERARLTTQTKVVDENLEHQLTATHHALNSIRADLPKLMAQKDGLIQLKYRLQIMRDAMPTTRAITIFDAEGTLVARSPDQFVGQNFSKRDYFQIARQGGNATTLYVAPPFLAATGDYVLNVSKVVLDARGGFGGVILVSLGPDYFSTLLKSVIYAPDMRSGLIHADGKVIFLAPDPEKVIGTDLAAGPDAFFTRHTASGQQSSVFEGMATSAGEARLALLRTIRPAAVPMDKPLVFVVSRELPALFASWRTDLLVRGGLYILLILAATLSMYFWQLRRKEYDRLVADQELNRQQTAEALRQQAEAQARSNAELTRLGEVMTHHFQEPTRRLMSFSKRLQGKPALVADEDSRLAVEFIDQEARRLSELVRDAQHYLALDHAKVGAGGTADSGAVLRQTIVANTDAAQAGIVLGEFMPKVRLAENLLSELFAILLDNALRYSKSERPLRIKVGATVSGERAVFRFADNGSGIAPEYRLQVFELFTRLVPSSIPGTGMGLALVQKIVQQNGGDVHVDDGIDGGACMVFDLPVELKV